MPSADAGVSTPARVPIGGDVIGNIRTTLNIKFSSTYLAPAVRRVSALGGATPAATAMGSGGGSRVFGGAPGPRRRQRQGFSGLIGCLRVRWRRRFNGRRRRQAAATTAGRRRLLSDCGRGSGGGGSKVSSLPPWLLPLLLLLLLFLFFFLPGFLFPPPSFFFVLPLCL